MSVLKIILAAISVVSILLSHGCCNNNGIGTQTIKKNVIDKDSINNKIINISDDELEELFSEKAKIKGNVRAKTETNFKIQEKFGQPVLFPEDKIKFVYDEDMNLLEKIELDSYDSMQQKCIFTYNPQGACVDISKYTKSGDPFNKIIYEWDDTGKLKSKTQHESNGVSKWVYQYDKNNRLVHRVIFKSFNESVAEETIKYDENNRLIEIDSMEVSKKNYSFDTQTKSLRPTYIPEGLRLKSVFKYNELGFIVSSESSRKSTAMPENADPQIFSSIYCYDQDGRKIKETSYMDKKITEETVYSYDNNGFLIRLTRQIISDKETIVQETNSYNSDGFLTETEAISTPIFDWFTYKTKYEYDTQGNIVKKTSFDLISNFGKMEWVPKSMKKTDYEYR